MREKKRKETFFGEENAPNKNAHNELKNKEKRITKEAFVRVKSVNNFTEALATK